MDYRTALNYLIKQYGLSILDNSQRAYSILCDLMKSGNMEKNKIDILYYLLKEYKIHKYFINDGYEKGIEEISNLGGIYNKYSIDEVKEVIEPLGEVLCLVPNNNQVIVKQNNNANVVKKKNPANKVNKAIKPSNNANSSNNIKNVNNNTSNNVYNEFKTLLKEKYKVFIPLIVLLTLLLADLVLMWFIKSVMFHSLVLIGLVLLINIYNVIVGITDLFNDFIRQILVFIISLNIILSGWLFNGYNFLILLWFVLYEVIKYFALYLFNSDEFLDNVLPIFIMVLIAGFIVGAIAMFYYMFTSLSCGWLLFFWFIELLAYPFLIISLSMECGYIDSIYLEEGFVFVHILLIIACFVISFIGLSTGTIYSIYDVVAGVMTWAYIILAIAVGHIIWYFVEERI